MSDQATLWKFVFGVLVLLFCSAAWLTRDGAAPPSTKPAALALPQAAPSAALPAASAPATQETAPPDVPEAQETPVRIRISFAEPKQVKRAPAAKAHKVRAHRHAARKQKPRYARVSNPISMPPWACQTCLPRGEGA